MKTEALQAREAGRELAYWTERMAIGAQGAAAARDFINECDPPRKEIDSRTLEDLGRRIELVSDFMLDALGEEGRSLEAVVRRFFEAVPRSEG